VVFSLITLPDRIRLASTCLTLKLMHSEYVQHQLTVVLASFGLDFCAVRLMLVATGSLMTGYAFQSILGGNILEQDTVDFYTTNRSTINVLMFLARSSGALSPTTANATWYTAWTLKIRGRTVRVIEHTSDPLEAILVCQESHIMGYCDGTRVRHAYGGLVLDGIALATRCSMPVERTLSEQQDIWNVLHAAIAHGFKWSYDLPGPHTCGVNPYCPCTPRSTKDGGWLTLHLPCANYGTAPFTDDGTWSLYGSGCTAGILEGGSLTRISRYDGAYGVIEVSMTDFEKMTSGIRQSKV
jgi:hypothetical protein